jgi:hypothetical protein
MGSLLGIVRPERNGRGPDEVQGDPSWKKQISVVLRARAR